MLKYQYNIYQIISLETFNFSILGVPYSKTTNYLSGSKQKRHSKVQKELASTLDTKTEGPL